MKYIIEIKPEYEDSFKGLMILGAKDSNLFVDTLAVEELEELNSDYINEHFGDLQDTAYQKGFEDGKKEAESSEVIEQAKVDAFNKGMLHKGEKIHDAYQRGLHEGNDIGYKDGFEDGKAVNDKGCEGCKLQGTDSNICDQCCNSYANQWKSKDDKIEVGDEVRLCRHKVPYIVTSCDGDDDAYILMTVNGGFIKAEKYNVRKTNRHFDIKGILEAMKHD